MSIDLMKLKPSMQDALNQQINAELYSAYLYLGMAAYFESMKLAGFAHWMKKQAQEELEHAMRFFDYVAKYGKVELYPIEKPKMKWQSPLAVFEAALKHEKHVTSLIHKLVNKATLLQNGKTVAMLDWFVEEQKEEGESASDIVDKIKSARSNLQPLDQELGKRK